MLILESRERNRSIAFSGSARQFITRSLAIVSIWPPAFATMITNYRSSPTLEAYISITTCVVAHRENRGVNRYRCVQSPPRISKTNALSYPSATLHRLSPRMDDKIFKRPSFYSFSFAAKSILRYRTTFPNLLRHFGTLEACILFAYCHEPTISIKDSCRHLI